MNNQKNIKVLIADDDFLISEEISRILKNIGYEVIGIASDGKQAIEMTCSLNPDVVLMDIKMHRLDGLEATKKIQQSCPTPVVVLTAHESMKLVNKASKMGAAAYLVKPLKPTEMERAITIAMARHGDLMKLHRLNNDLQQEIYKRKQAEKILVESENRFKVLSEATFEGIFITENGIIIDINKAAIDISGYSYNELIGMPAINLIATESKELVKNNILSDYRKPYEAITIFKNGIKLHIEIQGRTLNFNGKKVRITAVRDISERKKTEKIMLKASRMEATTTLAAGIAHDFNNLMVGVLGNADLLKLQYDTKPDTLNKLNSIADSAFKAGDLAKQLLAFARGGKYQPMIMNLNDSIQETLRLNESTFPSCIHIQRDLDPNLLNIKADPTQMNQVVMNLYINSVEAIENNGKIIITTRNIVIDEKFVPSHPPLKAGCFVYFSIEDTGCGIDTNTLSKIFEPFFSTKSHGRGLGLAAVYGIVKNHEGYIYVNSKVGIGTTFKIYLPSTELEVPIKQKKVGTTPSGTETILIIDDKVMILNVVQNILEKFGYRVLLAHNGQEAVDIVQNFEGDIHLALLDMGMPILGGTEAFPLIKKARPQIKIIICSGFELDIAAQKLLDAGADSFIQKPFRMQKLTQEIRRILDIKL